MRIGLLIFGFTALFSAFLLFQVEPLIGKSLLPWFGGAPLVWTTCMTFFQALLLLGYAYAHLSTTRLPPFWQIVVHLGVLSVGVVFSRVLPKDAWAPSGQEPPALHLLAILTVHVGAPFFALSATAPLLQSWFRGIWPELSPYPLYAVSNAGSMLGVLTYPFVFEPLFALSVQEILWSAGFVLFALGCIFCGAIFRLRAKAVAWAADLGTASNGGSGICSASGWTWLALSALGSVLLLSTTDQISQDIAASPLIWVMPLCLYLLSFIFCFAKDSLYHRKLWLGALPMAVEIMAVHLLFGGKWPVPLQLTLYGITLFTGCMVCHGELARLRPAARDLTRYYLIISVGGLVGGVSVAVVAPQAFPGMWEYPLCWLALMSLVLKRLYTEANRAIHERRSHLGLAVFGLGWVIAAAVFFADMVLDHRDVEAAYRNFFGRLAVSKKRDKLCLYHGWIQHGCQWSDPERALDPTTYYGRDSGVGVAVHVMREHREKKQNRGLQIGVVGLGIGTSAAYGRAGDKVRFFELDPLVVRIARDRFSYLRQSEAGVTVSIGDARVALERENGSVDHERFDVLVLDAFSGDAIPLHLLTREAFALYWRRLEPDGILAVHISNQHFDLEPLLLGHAAEGAKEALLIRTEESLQKLIYDSTWVILTGNEKAAKAIRDLGHAAKWPDELKDPIVFTDQHSNLLELL